MAQHISIRVPWHDNNWNGKICKNPKENTSCMVLKNIYENKKAEEEMENINKKLDCIKCPCISEGAGFMSNTSLQKTTIHPYAKNKNNKTHSHFRETIVEYPEYSIPSVPYALLMKDNIKKKKDIYNIKYNEENEPILDFKSEWVQDARNHRAIFDYFYKNVEKNKSLCLIYAKQVPFVDDNRRVIIGIGTVKAIIPAKEHEYDPNSKNELRSMTWETMIKHSIRENCEEGFIFPYKKMMEYANTHPEFDIET